MAGNEINAVILLGERELKVTQTVEQVMNLIEGVTSRHIPLIKVTDERGIEHQVNANQIIEFHAPIPYRSAGFS
jgi:hypothetical protein